MNTSKLVACGCGFVSCAVGAMTLEDDYGNKYEIGGFAKLEWSRAGQAPKTVPDALSTYTIDNRNALSSQPPATYTKGSKSSELGMQQLTLGVSRETDSAIGLEAKVTYRWRSARAFDFFKSPDVDYTNGGGLGGLDFTENWWASTALIWARCEWAPSCHALGRALIRFLTLWACRANGLIRGPGLVSCPRPCV